MRAALALAFLFACSSAPENLSPKRPPTEASAEQEAQASVLLTGPDWYLHAVATGHRVRHREPHVRRQRVDVRARAKPVLLSPLLSGAAGSQLPKSRGRAGNPGYGKILVGKGRRRISMRRDRHALRNGERV